MTSLNKFEQKSRERDPACSKNVRCCCDLRHFSFCRDPSTVRQPCTVDGIIRNLPRDTQNFMLKSSTVQCTAQCALRVVAAREKS